VRPQIVVANKTDVADGDPAAAAALERIRRHCATAGLVFHAISAATGHGLDALLRDAADRLANLPWAPVAS